MNIRSTPINHKQIYNLRTHGDKLSRLAGPFPSLVSFLEEMHENCPPEPFFSGPRSSSIHAGPVPVYDQLETHLRCEHTSQGLQVNANRFAEHHEQVQVYMLENDACTVAMEVPLWIDYQEAGVFQTLMTTDQFLSGHVDVLAIEEGLVWIWDYKPNASKERWVHVQLSAYALMLSHRTGISLENIRCGYFDDQSCFTFTPRQAHIDCFDFYSFVPADQNREMLFQQKPAKSLMPTIIFDEQGLYRIDIPDPPPEPRRRAGSGVGHAPAGSFRIIKDGDTTTFKDLLSYSQIEAYFDSLADTTKLKGDVFEQLCVRYLTHHPEWRNRFEFVWLWNDWPDKWGPDNGIDIVAKTSLGELWSIQCKCFHRNNSLTKAHLDSFVAESKSNRVFTKLLLMTTTDRIGNNADRLIARTGIEVWKRSDFQKDDTTEQTYSWPPSTQLNHQVIVFYPDQFLEEQDSNELHQPDDTYPNYTWEKPPVSLSSLGLRRDRRLLPQIARRLKDLQRPFINLFLCALIWMLAVYIGSDTPSNTISETTTYIPRLSSPPHTNTRVNTHSSYKMFTEIEVNDISASAVKFSKHHPFIAIKQSPTEISVNDFVTGETLAVEQFNNPIFAFQWTEEDKLAVLPANDLTKDMLLSRTGTFALVATAESETALINIFPIPNPVIKLPVDLNNITNFAISKSALQIAYCLKDNGVWFAEKANGEEIEPDALCFDSNHRLTTFEFAGSGKLATGSQNGTLEIHDTALDTSIHSIKSISTGLNTFSISPDKRMLVAGYHSGLIVIYYLNDSDKSHEILDQARHSISDIVFKNDSQAFCAVTSSGKLLIFGTENARSTTLPEKAKHGYRPLSEQQQLEQILERLRALDQ